MNLEEPVTEIKNNIHDDFDKRLIRLGIKKDNIQPRDKEDEAFMKANSAIEAIKDNENLSYEKARAKYLKEVTFTLFNRIAGIKTMEKRQLIPEIITVRSKHGDRSFAHNVWLEKNPDYEYERLEGLEQFIKDKFEELSADLALYSPDYPYDLLPAEHDLRDIIALFNDKIAEDNWEQDDILGWMYEAYNKKDYKQFKEDGDKIEWDKLSLSSQMYTPRWVVEFLVNNSLGKYWLEINPFSNIKENHDIANVPEDPVIEYKKIEEIKLIDPACGSGNFLLYAFDLLAEIYEEEGYDHQDIPNLILRNNLYGLDIDERAVQIARLQLYIKSKIYNRRSNIEDINVVSSNFRLPDFEDVRDQFGVDFNFALNEKEFMEELWSQLQQAYKFGSLIKLKSHMDTFLKDRRKQDQLGLFDGILDIENFEVDIIEKLKNVFTTSIENGFSTRFLKHQSLDALKFAEIMLGLSKKNEEYEANDYDIAVTNPPYTDSSNYGSELKEFVNANYKKPMSFHQNLYASFLKKNSDLINEQGKIGMIHPLTFMYIKSYQNVREFILDNFHINLLVEYGLGGVFEDSNINVDVAGYVIENNNFEKSSFFMNLQPYKGHSNKNKIFQEAYKNYVNDIKDKHNFTLNQDKLKIIDGYPFIYWNSDSFREKFAEEQLGDILDIKVGLQTGNNLRFLRFWWEVDKDNISENYEKDKKKWFPFQKGGPFKKWYGNNWLLVNWENEGYEIKNLYDENGRRKSRPQNTDYYFNKGVTYSTTSSKGSSYRFLSNNNIIGTKGSGIFPENNNIFYILGLLNTKLSSFILNSLNSGVETNINDNKRIPFVQPENRLKKEVNLLAKQNINQKKEQYKYDIIEKEFEHNPLDYNWQDGSLNIEKRLQEFIDFKYTSESKILLNEALIDELIFEVYELTESDREMVLEQEGLPSGMQPVFNEDRNNYLNEQDDLIEEVREFIKDLPVENERSRVNIEDNVRKLYKKNQSAKDIANELEINPITVVEIIKELDIYPKKLAYQKSHELILDLCREILNENEDGIVIVNEYAGEEPLDRKIENKLYDRGLTSGDLNRLESMLGKEIKNYLMSDFFADECNTLNLFRFLPKTPYVWHLSSGENHGFDAFTIIYRWSRDKLMKVKSYYIDKRRTGLNNKLSGLVDDDSASAEKEKDKIRKQLDEIEDFEDKLAELLSAGYDPKIDDGVGKNIAPLQKLGLLADDVLTSSQLDKFLNAEW